MPRNNWHCYIRMDETMQKTQTLTNYDDNASHYDLYRRPSPLILESLQTYFSGATRPILSIGCGTGRMEQLLSDNHVVIGLDRSAGMLKEARNRINYLTQGNMITLPFSNNSFSGAYFMQSLHHLGANLSINSKDRAKARIKAIQEVIRTIQEGPIIIIQRDPSQNMAVWFWHYFPQALEVKLNIQPNVNTIMGWLDDIGLREISATPLMDPMSRDFSH